MKLTHYLLGLLLAMAAGVAPADAQLYYVLFPRNEVSNTCRHLVIRITAHPVPPPVQPGFRITLRPTERTQIINADVVLLEDRGTGDLYEPRENIEVQENASCFIDQCDPGRFISMTCRWEHTQYVRFYNLDLKKRPIHK